MPIIVFCFLDTSYLLQEHKFIAMYNSFIKGSDEKPDVYTMPMKSFERGFRSFLKALKSWSILPVYGLLLLLGFFICIKFREPVKDKKTELPLKQETVIQDASENIVPEMILKPLE